jgi:hypothetical protein
MESYQIVIRCEPSRLQAEVSMQLKPEPFQTPAGKCSIGLENGELRFSTEDAGALPAIQEIARAMNAVVADGGSC